MSAFCLLSFDRDRAASKSSRIASYQRETKKDIKESIKNIFHEIIGQNKNVISLYEVVSEHFGLHKH